MLITNKMIALSQWEMIPCFQCNLVINQDHNFEWPIHKTASMVLDIGIWCATNNFLMKWLVQMFFSLNFLSYGFLLYVLGSLNYLWFWLQVNEYPCGVGLSPHIDTHSAFDELIFSLSTAGPCIMEFRRYPEGTWCHPTASVNEIHEDTPLLSSYITRKAIFLPPRSMLLMSGEGRYAWHHYIPHRKVCLL